MALTGYRRFLVGLLVCITLLLPAAQAQAQDRTLRWVRWDSDIQINLDGTFSVREVYEIEFIGGDFTFGYREIPIHQFSAIQNITVKEGGEEYIQTSSEAPYTYSLTRDEDSYSINWYYPPTANASRTFIVEYTVLGGIAVSDSGDALFWKAVGPEHAFPIETSRVTVHVPPGAEIDTSSADALAFFGADASTEVAQDRASVTFFATDIPVDQEFEVGVRFPHGFVPNERPAWQADAQQEEAWRQQWGGFAELGFLGVGLLFLVVGTAGVYVLWLMAGRDPDIGPVPAYLTDRPSDLPPGLAGTLVDEKVDLQDIIATVVDLARRGVLEMQEQERTVFGLATSREFVFRRKATSVPDLRKYESTLIREIFGSKDEIRLTDLREKFYASIPRLQEEIYRESVSEGLFPASPKAIRSRFLGLGVALGALTLGACFCVGAALPYTLTTFLCPFLGLAVTSVSLLAVSNVMPVKTRKGAEEAAKWKAFKTYLQSIERYADLSQVTNLFEQYLPYSIAFGLERTWISKFSRMEGVPIPGWYLPVGGPYHRGLATAGPSAPGSPVAQSGRDLASEAVRPAPSLDSASGKALGGLSRVSDGLFAMLNSAGSVFTSVPSSSGSSGGWSGGRSGGFSGGSFRSGGGGGGGGAGFG